MTPTRVPVEVPAGLRAGLPADRPVGLLVDVLVVDDNPIVRGALTGILAGDEGVRVVGEAANGREALHAARRLRPRVTLLDHRMPVADGMSVLAAIAQHSAVLVLTSDDDPALIAGMLHRGARGYLVHGSFDPPELLRAVHEVAGGRGWLSPVAASVAASLVRQQTGRDEQRRAFGLTGREEDVMRTLCEGLSNAAIAHRLRLTEKTVKNHLNHVFAKLQVRNRTEAVVRWGRPYATEQPG